MRHRVSPSSLCLLLALLFLSYVGLVRFVSSATDLTLDELGYSLPFTDDEKHQFLIESRDFLYRRAQHPLVHFFRDGKAYGEREASLGVLVQIMQTAESYTEHRWQALYARGIVSPSHPREPPACAAAAEEDGAVNGSDLNDRNWRRENPAAYTPLLTYHYNFTNCISPRNITEALEGFTADATMLSSRGYMTSEVDIYASNFPVSASYRHAPHYRMEKGLRPILKLIPEGETWRLDIPPELFQGEKGTPISPWPTPPNCRVRLDIRVLSVSRGRTSLARCRQLIAETFGYDPYARDRQSGGQAGASRKAEEGAASAAVPVVSAAALADEASAEEEAADL